MSDEITSASPAIPSILSPEEARVLGCLIEKEITPKALAIVVRASHLCCGWRGVRDEQSLMTTSVMRGLFRHDHAARQEFLSLIRGQGY
jgi:GTP cyclohydrolase I